MSNRLDLSRRDSDLRAIDIAIKDLEEFAKVFFENERLKLGFRVFNGQETVSLSDYLLYACSQADFKIYFVDDEDFDNYSIVEHDLRNGNIFLGGFELAEMHGCCGIAVLFHCFISIDYRNKGFGQRLTRLEKALASYKNYTMLICTDQISNTSQRKIMDKFGFIRQFQFRNRKTNNLVELRASSLNNNEYYDQLWKKKPSIFPKFENLKNLVKRTYTKILTS